MEKTYSVTETAKMLGYSRNSIYSFLKEGNLKGARIGKGKIRITQSEIDRFLRGEKNEANIITPEEKKASKKIVEEMVREAKEESQPTADEETVVLVPPRPGKSLEELSGERPINVMRLWFEERVGIPRLFDWLVGLSSIILGVSMFLHSKQVDSLLVGRFSDWFIPIQISLILSGAGLIVADMVQEEFVLYRNLSNYFRAILFMTYTGLAWILFLGNDLDGFMLYGLFGLVILLEGIFSLRSSAAYMIYIQSLFMGTAVLYLLFPAETGLSLVADGANISDGFRWIWALVTVFFVSAALYGYFWEKKVLKNISALVGLLLVALSLFYANNNYWNRSFFVLVAGMVGLIMPFWKAFRKKFQVDRPLVFKMFGAVLMFFSLVVVIVGIVQSILMRDANRRLADKARFGVITVDNTITGALSAIEGVAGNPLFRTAFIRENSEDVQNFLNAIFKNNRDLGIVIAVSRNGEVTSSYPFSADVVSQNYSSEIFFRNVSGGKNFVSRTAETMNGVDSATIITSVPILENGEVIGAILATVNLDSLGERLGEALDSSEEQEVSLVDADGRWLVSPVTAGVVGERLEEIDTTNLMWQRPSGSQIGYDSLGKYRLFRSGKSSDRGWTVVVSEPIFAILSVSQTGLMVILLLLFVAVTTVSFSYLFARAKVGP